MFYFSAQMDAERQRVDCGAQRNVKQPSTVWQASSRAGLGRRRVEPGWLGGSRRAGPLEAGPLPAGAMEGWPDGSRADACYGRPGRERTTAFAVCYGRAGRERTAAFAMAGRLGKSREHERMARRGGTGARRRVVARRTGARRREVARGHDGARTRQRVVWCVE